MKTPEPLIVERFITAMEELIARAELNGIVLRTERVALEPLALGNAATIVDWSYSHAVYRDPENAHLNK